MKKERTRNVLPAYVGIYGIIIFVVNTIATNLAFVRTMVFILNRIASVPVLTSMFKSPFIMVPLPLVSWWILEYCANFCRTWTATSAPWWWPSPPTSTSASTAPPSSSTPVLSSAETSAGCSASGNTTLKVSNKISREYIQRISLLALSANCLSVKVLWTQFLVERPCV